MTTIRYAVPLALAVGLLSACGAGQGAGPGEASATSPGSGASSAATDPSAGLSPSANLPKPSSTPTLGAGPKGMRLSVLGTVSVRQGDCLLFTPGDQVGSWVLVGDAAKDLQPGKGYTIEGVLAEDSPEGCPQGQGFTVDKATPAR